MNSFELTRILILLNFFFQDTDPFKSKENLFSSSETGNLIFLSFNSYFLLYDFEVLHEITKPKQSHLYITNNCGKFGLVIFIIICLTLIWSQNSFDMCSLSESNDPFHVDDPFKTDPFHYKSVSFADPFPGDPFEVRRLQWVVKIMLSWLTASFRDSSVKLFNRPYSYPRCWTGTTLNLEKKSLGHWCTG